MSVTKKEMVEWLKEEGSWMKFEVENNELIRPEEKRIQEKQVEITKAIIKEIGK